MSRAGQLVKSYKYFQNFSNNIKVELIDECIEKWLVTLLYENDKIIILNFEYYLVDNIAPKILVIFPTTIKYVCFAELGSKLWTTTNDIETLIINLYAEYSNKAEKYKLENKFSNQTAEANWNFVKNAHKEWEYLNVTELNNNISLLVLDKIKTEVEKQLDELHL